MTSAEQIADQIGAVLPDLKTGTLRFWGEWFGKPYDNIHVLVAVEAVGEVLKLHFDEGEALTIWRPEDCRATGNEFVVQNADRVRWDWYSYGQPKTAENLYYEDFERHADLVTASTNVDWYEPNLKPSVDFPAVAIL